MFTLTKNIVLRYLIFLLWLIFGIYIPEFSYVFIILSYFLLMVKGRDAELLIGLFFLLILSDSYYLPFAQKIKPIVFLLFCVYTIRNNLGLGSNIIFKSLVPFFVLSAFVSAISPNISAAFQKYISYLLLFLCVPSFLNYFLNKYGNKILLILLQTCVVVLIAGLVISIVKPEVAFSHGSRYRGFFGNPNGLGIFAFLVFVLYEVCKKHLDLMFSFAERAMFTCLVLGSLVFTQSRGSMLGCLLFISMQRLGRLSSIFLILVVVIYASASDDIIRIAFSIVNSLELGDALRLESIEQLEKGSGRTIAWQFAWEEIQKNFFFGRGWSYDEIYMGGVVKQILLKLDHQGGVHNSFLIFWLNVGIVGLLLFIGSLFYLILRTSRTSPLAMPFFAGALFIANFEPWLSASLNPYTILYLMIVTLLLKEKSTGEEELA